ncbi:MAG: queuosine precursor transporter, partial [Bacteroidales bacterium]|nr:queuosine precursor transporter [Bacteroidales bacterium]
MKKTFSLAFVLLGILFNVCLIVSNILEVKLIAIGPVMATAGLMVFPISYILNDCIAEVWGYRKARFVIWTGFAMNFFTVGFIQLAGLLPPAPGWDNQDAFVQVFASTPRIAIASFTAFLVGSFLNAYVMSRMKIRSKGRHF